MRDGSRYLQFVSIGEIFADIEARIVEKSAPKSRPVSDDAKVVREKSEASK